MQIIAKSLTKRELDIRVEKIFLKILKRAKHYPLGLNGFVAKYAYETDQKIAHIKELKQQIDSTRPSMELQYGKSLIRDIVDLPIKFRKLKPLSNMKELSEQAAKNGQN
jgi:hypothetical protein